MYLPEEGIKIKAVWFGHKKHKKIMYTFDLSMSDMFTECP